MRVEALHTLAGTRWLEDELLAVWRIRLDVKLLRVFLLAWQLVKAADSQHPSQWSFWLYRSSGWFVSAAPSACP
jgi:hypothetical protein